METNKTKYTTKNYLAEQFYNYNKKYIIEDVKQNKQDNLEIVSNHITWEDGKKLGLNITNDRDAKPYDYLVLEPWEDDDYYEDEFGDKIYDSGKLIWETPISSQDDISSGSKRLVNGNAVYTWKGSENITTLGQITTGSWKVEKLELISNANETYEKIGNFKFEFLDSDANTLKITGSSDNNGNADIVIAPKISLSETNISGKTTISPDFGEMDEIALKVDGRVEITGRLNGKDAEFSGGITAGEDEEELGEAEELPEDYKPREDTTSTIKGALNVSKLTVYKNLTANGSVKFGNLEAGNTQTETLAVNTIKKIGDGVGSSIEGEGAEGSDSEYSTEYEYLSNSIKVESKAAFKADKLFIGSETNIIITQETEYNDGTVTVELNKPIKINGKYIQLATDKDVDVYGWIYS